LLKCFFSVPKKPIFAAQNGVNPYGIYIFLAKDLVVSKKNITFVGDFGKKYCITGR
jgi:hypothetical protein